MSKRYKDRVLVIPYGGEDHLTVVFRGDKTGHVLNATNGECSESVTFANGRIAATRHAQSGDWIVAIPDTDIKSLYGTMYHAPVGDVDNNTVPDTPNATAFMFDMRIGSSFSDMLPMASGRVLVE